MSSLDREVGEIHTKVDHLITLVEKQNGRVTKVEEQVSKIRRFQSYMIGIFTAIGTGTGALFHKFLG